jgi:hypothetical protein
MMMLKALYSVALYTSDKCTLHNKVDGEKWVINSSQCDDSAPNPSQLTVIQKTLNANTFTDVSRVVILVPDTWLSVSQHHLDHLVPTSLLPLAALSYAAETTFSPPETLLFSYQQKVMDNKQTQLTVFACSEEWAKQLCVPFQSLNVSCLLMSMTQWRGLRSSSRSWSYLKKNALSTYQPDDEKRQKRKRLWFCFILLSLLIHGVAYGYFCLLQQDSHQAQAERQKILAVRSIWESSRESSEFAHSVLSLVQGLPMSVRLTLLEVEEKQASFQLTLSEHELEQILANWRKASPHWHWDVSKRSQHQISPSEQYEEVLDVFISIVEN